MKINKKDLYLGLSNYTNAYFIFLFLKKHSSLKKNFFYFDDENLSKIQDKKPKIYNILNQFKSCDFIDKIKENLQKYKINYINIEDDIYPEKLKNIKDPPLNLFYKGNKELLKNKILAIVGTRNSTKYGEKCCKIFSSELSKKGITIISGLALGIDKIAHLYSFNEKGKTIAVLGTSLHKIYPKDNIFLADEILKNDGLLLSEVGFFQDVKPYFFARRNRIVSGLSTGVLVIEAPKKSGTMITVDFALDQGKDVFCVPGKIGDKNSEGVHELIKQGAKLTDKVDDILQERDFVEFSMDEDI